MLAVCVPSSSTDCCHKVNQGSSARVTELVMSPNSYLRERRRIEKCPRAPCGGCSCWLHMLSLILAAEVYHCWEIFNMNRIRHKHGGFPAATGVFTSAQDNRHVCYGSLPAAPCPCTRGSGQPSPPALPAPSQQRVPGVVFMWSVMSLVPKNPIGNL